jgi:hypothetical protein
MKHTPRFTLTVARPPEGAALLTTLIRGHVGSASKEFSREAGSVCQPSACRHSVGTVDLVIQVHQVAQKRGRIGIHRFEDRPRMSSEDVFFLPRRSSLGHG